MDIKKNINEFLRAICAKFNLFFRTMNAIKNYLKGRDTYTVDFIIFIALASIISAIFSIGRLSEIYEYDAVLTKWENDNKLVYGLQWIIESEIEASAFFNELSVTEISNYNISQEASKVALTFITRENENDEGKWMDYKESSEKLLDSFGQDTDIESDLKRVRFFLKEYMSDLDAYIKDQRDELAKQRGDVSRVVYIIFCVHIALYIVSMRFDLDIDSKVNL